MMKKHKKSQSEQFPRQPIIKRLISAPVQAEAIIDLEDVIGEIDPRIYGHSVTTMEHCLYDGVFSPDGRQTNANVMALIKELKPPIIRMPCEPTFNLPDDPFSHASKRNQIGMNDLLAICHEAGAEPYLVIDHQTTSPEEAARFVSNYNVSPDKVEGISQGIDRFYPHQPVKLWGLDGLKQGEGQVNPANAQAYTRQLQPMIKAMRAVDPTIEISAAGTALLEGDPIDAKSWNHNLLMALGNQINYLTFQLYHPGEAGFQEDYDPVKLYHSIVAAPHSAEDVIYRMAAQIQDILPNNKIGLALDAYNVKIPPPPGAHSLHDQAYRLRDGLYVAGMLNVFHRQCNFLKIANIAHLVNALPVITKPINSAAFPTSLYFPFKLYQMMEKQVVEVGLWSPFYKSEPLGQTISRKDEVPYIDITATRSDDAHRLTFGIINRHPHKSSKVTLNLKSESSRNPYHIHQAWEMSGPDPLAANTAEVPDRVNIRQIKAPKLKFGWLDAVLPAASLVVLTLEN